MCATRARANTRLNDDRFTTRVQLVIYYAMCIRRYHYYYYSSIVIVIVVVEAVFRFPRWTLS